MKPAIPYTLSRSARTTLHVGNHINKETGALIFEPVTMEGAQILMVEDAGPFVMFGGLLWPVRTYTTSYSFDRLMSMERFQNNAFAVSLYPFERQAAEGLYHRQDGRTLDLMDLPHGEARRIDAKILRSLQDRVLVLPTERRGELRLLTPYLQALADIVAPEPVRVR